MICSKQKRVITHSSRSKPTESNGPSLFPTSGCGTFCQWKTWEELPHEANIDEELVEEHLQEEPFEEDPIEEVSLEELIEEEPIEEDPTEEPIEELMEEEHVQEELLERGTYWRRTLRKVDWRTPRGTIGRRAICRTNWRRTPRGTVGRRSSCLTNWRITPRGTIGRRTNWRTYWRSAGLLYWLLWLADGRWTNQRRLGEPGFLWRRVRGTWTNRRRAGRRGTSRRPVGILWQHKLITAINSEIHPFTLEDLQISVYLCVQWGKNHMCIILSLIFIHCTKNQ